MNTAEIIVIIMLTVWSILMIAAGWNNHGRKRKYEYTGNIRKIKRKYVNKIGYYRSVMAFYRKHLPENEWVNNDIRSISKGVFLHCTKN